MINIVLRYKCSTRRGVVIYITWQKPIPRLHAFGGITVADAGARKKPRIKTRILLSNDVLPVYHNSYIALQILRVHPVPPKSVQAVLFGGANSSGTFRHCPNQHKFDCRKDLDIWSISVCNGIIVVAYDAGVLRLLQQTR